MNIHEVLPHYFLVYIIELIECKFPAKLMIYLLPRRMLENLICNSNYVNVTELEMIKLSLTVTVHYTAYNYIH